MFKKNKKFILFLAAFLIGWLWSFGVATAAPYGLKLTSSVSVSGSGRASIKQVFSVTGADKQNLPGKVNVNIVGVEPAGVVATGTDNAKLTTQYDAEANTVFITIPDDKRDTAKAWSFSLKYQSNLLETFGATKAAQVPAMDTNLDVTSQVTTIAADLDLGFATVRSVQPSKTSIGVGQQILTFDSKGLQDKSLYVVFGDETYATATFSTKLENRTWWWQDVGITLPPDTNQQRVLIDSIQPTPSRVKLDKDGNIVAFFNIAPLGSRQVEVTAHLSIDNPTYQLDSATSLDQTDPQLIDRYTRATDAWQPLNLQLDIKDGATSADVAKAVFDGVVAKAQAETTGQEQFSLTPRMSALKISDWLVGELRARGIPAREVLGLEMSNGNTLGQDTNQHAWVEANLAGVGWVTMDPYFGVFNGQYGSADPLRVGLALWGLEDNKPPVDLSLANLKYVDEAPEEADSYGQISVSAKKYMVFPFVSVYNQSASLSPGGIVDGVSLLTPREELFLGSLAPYQTATQRSLVFGATSFKEETLQAKVAGSDETTADSTSSTSYLVLIVEASLLLVFLFIRWWRHKHPSQPSSRLKRSKESLTLHDEATGGSIEQENLVNKPDILPHPQPPKPNREPEAHHKPPKLVQ